MAGVLFGEEIRIEQEMGDATFYDHADYVRASERIPVRSMRARVKVILEAYVDLDRVRGMSPQALEDSLRLAVRSI